MYLLRAGELWRNASWVCPGRFGDGPQKSAGENKRVGDKVE